MESECAGQSGYFVSKAR